MQLASFSTAIGHDPRHPSVFAHMPYLLCVEKLFQRGALPYNCHVEMKLPTCSCHVENAIQSACPDHIGSVGSRRPCTRLSAHATCVSQVPGFVRLQPSVRAMRVPASAPAGTPRDVHIVRHRGSFTASVRRKQSKHVTSPSGAM